MPNTHHSIRNTSDLLSQINKGSRVKYVFFWGHQPSRNGSISKSCFSQWYDAKFELNSIVYQTAEHYMMAEKARLFDNDTLIKTILNVDNPGKAKKLGREVVGFDEQVWKKERTAIVVRGNHAKFSQNPELCEFLLNTGKRVLVEASPRDRVWGIGLTKDDPQASSPENWQGLNLLGFALMEVRDLLSKGSDT